MGRVLASRRGLVAVLSVLCLTSMALVKGIDTSMAIASVAIGLAASNSYQKRGVTPP